MDPTTIETMVRGGHRLGGFCPHLPLATEGVALDSPELAVIMDRWVVVNIEPTTNRLHQPASRCREAAPGASHLHANRTRLEQKRRGKVHHFCSFFSQVATQWNSSVH
jgi:hypothetical protein